ncbi:hypothetical protein QAD02_019858 [Eretmocerus hayati]|uniref:Uncharacterized protein n=1 Tax=Eretmocerus hayati TaxID=131215 RepID=A0ACC2PKS6_9HYME|nr:hypothetical protein QAD02_019858 [Eretmocerus hayati]
MDFQCERTAVQEELEIQYLREQGYSLGKTVKILRIPYSRVYSTVSKGVEEISEKDRIPCIRRESALSRGSIEHKWWLCEMKDILIEKFWKGLVAQLELREMLSSGSKRSNRIIIAFGQVDLLRSQLEKILQLSY